MTAVSVAAPSCGRPEPFDQVLDSAAAAQLPEHAPGIAAGGPCYCCSPATAAALGTAAAQLTEHTPGIAMHHCGQAPLLLQPWVLLQHSSLSMPGASLQELLATASQGQGRDLPKSSLRCLACSRTNTTSPTAAAAPSQGQCARQWTCSWSINTASPTAAAAPS